MFDLEKSLEPLKKMDGVRWAGILTFNGEGLIAATESIQKEEIDGFALAEAFNQAHESDKYAHPHALIRIRADRYGVLESSKTSLSGSIPEKEQDRMVAVRARNYIVVAVYESKTPDLIPKAVEGVAASLPELY